MRIEKLTDPPSPFYVMHVAGSWFGTRMEETRNVDGRYQQSTDCAGHFRDSLGTGDRRFLSFRCAVRSGHPAREPTNLPVDVEHVLAAIVLAVRQGELDPTKSLSSDDPASVAVLVRHVKTVFREYDGQVGTDD